MDLIPDKNFVKQLHVISKDLSVKWERTLERWVIDYKNPSGQIIRILEVKNPDSSYRPLDERTLEVLRLSDMSAKVKDIKYLISEQYQKAKYYKELARKKNREKALERSREISQKKWNDAIDNAEKGIWSTKNLDKRVFSIPSATFKLAYKFGLPKFTKKAIEINPNKENNNGGSIII